MEDKKSLVIEAIESIDETTQLLYQQDIQGGYDKLKYTLDILARLSSCINTNEVEEEKEIQAFNDILNNALQAMEQGDTILLSDILKYDLKELLEKIL